MNIKVIGREALQDGLLYLVANPTFLLRAALNAARLRLGVPLDALRWLIAHLAQGPKAPQDIELRAAAPDVALGATVNLMGTSLRIGANLHFEDLHLADEQLLLGVRIQGLTVQAPEQSPIRQMLAAMDLSNPGNLVPFMPRRPPGLVEAREDLFVFDLLKSGKARHNPALRRALLALFEVVGVRDVTIEGDLLVVALSAQPLALPAALRRLRG